MTGKRLLVIIVIMCLAMVSPPASAGEFELDDDLALDIHPISLTLRPYGQGEFVLQFRNDRTEAVTVFVEVDDGNYTLTAVVEVTPDLLAIGQGGTGTVTIRVMSRAHYFRSGSSGVLLSVAWGPYLTVSNGSVDPSTVEGTNGFYLDIADDYYVSNPYYLGSFLMTLSAVIVVMIVWFLRSRKRPSTSGMKER